MATAPDPPADLERFWQPPPASLSALPALRTSLARLPSPPLRISRVAQLDAALLDGELENILHAPVKSALEGLRNAGQRSWEPELLALLRLAVMRMSLYETGATYGSALQNLRYRNEAKHVGGLQGAAVDSTLTRVQKLAYTALVVLPPYLHSKLQDRMLSSSWADEPLPPSWFALVDVRRLIRARGRRREEEVIQWKREWKRTGWEMLGVAEKLANLAGLVNFLIFLHNGRHRTLFDRVLKMRLVYAQRSFVPNVSFEYLNRQLVWEAFTEFLLFILPLINLHRFRPRLSKAISSRASKSRILRAAASSLPAPIASTLGLSSLSASSSSSKQPSGLSDKPQGPYAFLPLSTCPICYHLSTAGASALPGAIGSASMSTFADPTLPSASLLTSSSAAAPSGPSGPGGGDSSVKIPYRTVECRFGCRYCYYCIVGALAKADEEADDHWDCLRCGGEVRSVIREEVEGGVVDAEGEPGGEDEREEGEEEKQQQEREEGEDSETGGYEVVEAAQ
ncbi:hypothetical protein JCM8097_008478 [Rhodosporidiobolus ruineniae]